MALIQQLSFPVRGDHRGLLVPIEANDILPFQIRRIYYLFKTSPGVRRGLHAHHKLRQAAVCIQGRCKFLLDDGSEQQIVQLDNPAEALLIEPMVWHEMFDFSENAVLLVLADDHYEESDYIRVRAEFDRLVGVGLSRP
jgi:dTDP-4-dehydrorhamnose 3,5-epimerase-like enzyme